MKVVELLKKIGLHIDNPHIKGYNGSILPSRVYATFEIDDKKHYGEVVDIKLNRGENNEVATIELVFKEHERVSDKSFGHFEDIKKRYDDLYGGY